MSPLFLPRGPWRIENGAICLPNGRAIIKLDDIAGEDDDQIAAIAAAITTIPDLIALVKSAYTQRQALFSAWAALGSEATRELKS